MIGVLLVTLSYGTLFMLVELSTKKLHINKESSRKLVHITAGVSAACLPIILSFHQIALVSLLFIPVMVASKRLNLFSSIHEVTRRTYGEIYFPFAILILALLFPRTYLYVYGLLVMAISDGFAGIIGQKYGKRTYELGLSQKSYAGSLTFFISAAVIGGSVLFGMTGANSFQVVSVALGSGVVLTVVEACLSFGLDNLLIPPLAALLLLIAAHIFMFK